MRRTVAWTLFALSTVASACRYTFDDQPPPLAVDAAPSPQCIEAEGYQNFAAIRTKILDANCSGTSCHVEDERTVELKFDDMPYEHLLNLRATLDDRYKLVEPFSPAQSYIMYMIREIPPEEMDPPMAPGTAPDPKIGFMPSSSQPLCEQKRGAIRRWIEAGAMND